MLRNLPRGWGGHKGIVAVMTNGHTGEVFALTPEERAEVTRIVADELKGKLPVISSVVCEGLGDAAHHARLAVKAGAVGIDVMPPHHWLRFGFHPQHALDYFDNIYQASGVDLICHVYPAWTKASYSSALLADLARLPYVQAFKVGQRDMSKYARDIKAIRDADASKAILTCHDEYLLASMVQGVDGALVGFASAIRSSSSTLNAVHAGDLKRRWPCSADHADQRSGLRRRRADGRSAPLHEGRDEVRRCDRTQRCARRREPANKKTRSFDKRSRTQLLKA